MASCNNDQVISLVRPHTVKKFELIESYVETWAQKLLNTPKCEGIVFIDCMCNSGVYKNENSETVYGTPVRVARKLRDAAGQYPSKQIYIYLNDNNPEKIELLKLQLPKECKNFHYSITAIDANERLKQIGPNLHKKKCLNFFLLYDPYDATIDWLALAPFFRNWGEVLINHMVSDSVRAIKQAKSQKAIEKYEGTYLSDFEDLLPCGSDKKAYEKRVEQIITKLKGAANRRYYIAAFPFFNGKNSLVYDLVHCTSNIAGFKLYKHTAWKTFGGKSSLKNTHGIENQFMLDMDGGSSLTTHTDENCYYVKDIVDYIQNQFAGQADVPFSELWDLLDEHPVFPSDGYCKIIKSELKSLYGAKVSRSTISFSNRSV